MGCGASKLSAGPSTVAPARGSTDEEKLGELTPSKGAEGGGAGKRSSVTAEPGTKRGEGDVNVAAALRSKQRGRHILPTNDVQLRADFVKPVVSKSREERRLIGAALRANVLFASLGDATRRDLINAMEPQEVAEGEVLIEQGDEGDFFYVIHRGKFDIVLDGKVVATFGDGSPNKSFGELALLYNSPRAATVKASTVGRVFRIDRGTFRNVMASMSREQHSKLVQALRAGVLSKVEDASVVDAAARAATIVRYNTGDQIICKGDTGEVFYVIASGHVFCRNMDGDQVDNRLEAGDYFGERALLLNEPRAADVFAGSDVELIAIHHEDFNVLLPSLRETFESNLGMRLLLCVPIISGLSAEDKGRLFQALELREYKDGDVVIAAGKVVEHMFIVRSGNVQMVVDDGSKMTMCPGQWFGEHEMHTEAKAGTTVKASGDLTLCYAMPRSVYMELIAPQGEALCERPLTSSKSWRQLRSEYKLSRGTNAKSFHLKKVPKPTEAEARGAAAAAAATGGGGTASDIGGTEGDGSHVALERVHRWRRLGLPLSSFDQKATLGTGTFGRVRLVYNRDKDQTFALKIMHKSQIVALKQQRNILNEKRVLSMLNHPFVIRLYDTYKDSQRLYMLLELVQGGELFSRLQNASPDGRVTSDEARFHASCVLDVLEHVHSRGIVYRDLKPENLLIDSFGYIKVVDFGFAKIVGSARTYTLCGTPEYLAPELVLGEGHDKGVDYWALGILIYEMIAGYSPFADHENGDQMKVCRNILRSPLEWPKDVRDRKLMDVVAGLLERSEPKRLGCLRGGASDVKKHPFFRSLDFEQLRQRAIPPPWKPRVQGKFDTTNFDPYDEKDNFPHYKDDHSGWDDEF